MGDEGTMGFDPVDVVDTTEAPRDATHAQGLIGVPSCSIILIFSRLSGHGGGVVSFLR